MNEAMSLRGEDMTEGNIQCVMREFMNMFRECVIQ